MRLRIASPEFPSEIHSIVCLNSKGRPLSYPKTSIDKKQVGWSLSADYAS